MDTEPRPAAIEDDPATQAFARLEGEMALMRRAVEHLAAEKTAITIPDYSTTLGEMAKKLAAIAQGTNAIADKPAMRLTPDDMAARIDAVGRQARQADAEALRQVRIAFDQESNAMRQIVGNARTALEQRRHLRWATAIGLAAGVVLWSFLPGTIARMTPESWQLPETMAARMLGESTLWEAGTRLMRVGSLPTFNALTQANEMLRDNRRKIDQCRREAARTGREVRCAIQVKAS